MIAQVRCNTHRNPVQGCQRCADADRITMMILHERDECGGAERCFMCGLMEDG